MKKLLGSLLVIGFLVSSLICAHVEKSDDADWRFVSAGKRPYLAISSDGKLLAIGSQILPTDANYGLDAEPIGGTIELWSLETRSLLRKTRLNSAVRFIAFTPDDEQVVAAVGNGKRSTASKLRLPSQLTESGFVFWDVDGNRPVTHVSVPNLPLTVSAARQDSTLGAVLTSSEGDRSLWFSDMAGTPEKSIAKWLESTAEQLRNPSGKLALAKGQLLIVGCEHDNSSYIEHTVEYWDIKNRIKLGQLKCNSTPQQIATSPDGNSVAILDSYGIIAISDTRGNRISDSRDKIYAQIDTPIELAYGPTNIQLAIGGGYEGFKDKDKGVVTVWSVPAWNHIATFKLDKLGSTICSVAFLEKGGGLITGSYDGTICLWLLHR